MNAPQIERFGKAASQPLLSIIVLNCNGAMWLAKCFETIKAQTIISQIETVMVDNMRDVRREGNAASTGTEDADDDSDDSDDSYGDADADDDDDDNEPAEATMQQVSYRTFPRPFRTFNVPADLRPAVEI
jgi:hypothetical protein